LALIGISATSVFSSDSKIAIGTVCSTSRWMYSEPPASVWIHTVAVNIRSMPRVSSEVGLMAWLRSSKAPLGEVMSMPYLVESGSGSKVMFLATALSW